MPQMCVVTTRAGSDPESDVVHMHRTKFPPIPMMDDEEMWMDIGDDNFMWMKEKNFSFIKARLGSFAIVPKCDVPKEIVSFLSPT